MYRINIVPKAEVLAKKVTLDTKQRGVTITIMTPTKAQSYDYLKSAPTFPMVSSMNLTKKIT